MIAENTQCKASDGTTGVMCWAQCYSMATTACGLSAECMDTKTGLPVDGTIECPSAGGMGACAVQCPAMETPYGRGV